MYVLLNVDEIHKKILVFTGNYDGKGWVDLFFKSYYISNMFAAVITIVCHLLRAVQDKSWNEKVTTKNIVIFQDFISSLYEKIHALILKSFA